MKSLLIEIYKKSKLVILLICISFAFILPLYVGNKSSKKIERINNLERKGLISKVTGTITKVSLFNIDKAQHGIGTTLKTCHLNISYVYKGLTYKSSTQTIFKPNYINGNSIKVYVYKNNPLRIIII